MFFDLPIYYLQFLAHIYFSFYFEHVMMIPFVIVITLYQIYKKLNDVIILCHEYKKNTKNQIEKFDAGPFFSRALKHVPNCQLILNRVSKKRWPTTAQKIRTSPPADLKSFLQNSKVFSHLVYI